MMAIHYYRLYKERKMKTQTISVPQFLYTQVNKDDDGNIISQKDVMKANLASACDAFDNMPNDPADCFVICSRERVGDDFRYGICVSPMKRDCDFVRCGMQATFPPLLLEPIRNKKIGNLVESMMTKVFDKLLSLL